MVVCRRKRSAAPLMLAMASLATQISLVEAFARPVNTIDKATAMQGLHDSCPAVPEDSEASNIKISVSNVDEARLSRRNFLSSAAAATLATTSILVATPSNADAADAAPAAPAKANQNDAVNSELLASTAAATVDWQAILQKSAKKALGGGKAGASAAVVQVCSLMWLRTAMNYQYRYGGDLGSSLSKLWQDGGLPRLYQGLPFAIFQGPLTRFGDTAANVGILAILESFDTTASLPLPLKTACGSAAAGLWRIFLMPVDSSKTAMQVEGSEGLKRLWEKVGDVGPSPLYQGALASAAATAVGHFPWFMTYNFLNDNIPTVSSNEDLLLSFARAAFVGLCASCVSDVTSNSLRVIKTTKQTGTLGGVENSKSELTYKETLDLILQEDGVLGLFGRGLQTRLLANMIQGAAFSVLWKYFQQVGGGS